MNQVSRALERSGWSWNAKRFLFVYKSNPDIIITPLELKNVTITGLKDYQEAVIYNWKKKQRKSRGGELIGK